MDSLCDDMTSLGISAEPAPSYDLDRVDRTIKTWAREYVEYDLVERFPVGVNMIGLRWVSGRIAKKAREQGVNPSEHIDTLMKLTSLDEETGSELSKLLRKETSDERAFDEDLEGFPRGMTKGERAFASVISSREGRELLGRRGRDEDRM